MRERISSSTWVFQPGRAVSALFRHTSHTEEDSAADSWARIRMVLSVWMGHEAATTNPARMIEETRVSQASGCLLAKATTMRPSGVRASWQERKARNIPSS
ncbi:MAG: hypothetical protein DDT34_01837 [Firmicutes bacterium]|nr:hypothetical protein [Bacillota bacterium]